MALDNGNVVTMRSVHEEEGNASATSSFVEREIVPHLDLAEYRRLCPNTLNTRRFGAVFREWVELHSAGSYKGTSRHGNR